MKIIIIQSLQYPLDLGNNGLGHYILFESGFVGYSAQTSGLLDTGGRQKKQKVTSKLGNKSITTSAIALYMHHLSRQVINKHMKAIKAGLQVI